MTDVELGEIILAGTGAVGGGAGLFHRRKRKLHARASEHVDTLAQKHGWNDRRKAVELTNLKRRRMR